MKKFMLLITVIFTITAFAQKATYQPGLVQYSGPKKTARKPATNVKTVAPAIYPVQKPALRNVVYQYIDTTYPDAENHFPVNGNAGIGTSAPQSALEIKRNAGDTRKKNVLLQLSNEYSPNGQNEPSIMFSNGDMSNPANVSYWTVGARVSGDNTLKTPQTFKISYKAPNSTYEQEFFAVDSYMGRVKIGDVNTNYDGYKLYVEEGILTEKVKVAVKNSEDWFDHVLASDYKLMPLVDLERFIAKNNHLPDVPTTKDVMTNGVDLGKMNGILLKKVEELTLYMIEMKKDLEQTKKELEETKKKLN